MSSILTNSSAMTALQTLSMTNKNLATTQNRIATGQRVSTASDNAAYWSIATTMRSDNGALSAVQDALGLGAATVDIAYTAVDKSVKELDEIKKLLAAATDSGLEGAGRAKIQKDIDARLDALKSYADSAVFNGENMLSVDSSAAGYNVKKSVVSSFSRAGGVVAVGTTDISLDDIKLYDANATLTAITAPADLTKAWKTENGGVFDSTWSVDTTYDDDADPLTAEVALTTTLVIDDLDVSTITNSAADTAKLKAYLSIVDGAIGALTDSAGDLGAMKNRISGQQDFVKSMRDAIDRGVGQLVDADMNAESTRLQALQVQQQLGIQALSIANGNSQSILSLFRG